MWRQKLPRWVPESPLTIGQQYRIDPTGKVIITMLSSAPARLRVRVGGTCQATVREYEQQPTNLLSAFITRKTNKFFN